jgi:predicted ATP-grasp superfamily ATP-dependent carboligase
VRILIAGLTTRAIAESAVRAGCDVVTVDYFGDLDQKRTCPNVSLRELGLKYSAAALLEAARDLAYDAAAYTGGLENHPGAVARLAAGRTLLGNAPDTLRRVRDPGQLFPFLASRGFAVPETIRPGEPLPSRGRWLAKPLRGGGGVGIRVWGGQPLAPGQILQAYVEGTPGSAAFVADGRRCVLLGWTEQLRGPQGFLYGGNVLPLEAPAAALDAVRGLAAALAEGFGLVGLNGFDFVLREEDPVLVEVNPRYCASMELWDQAAGRSAFALHLAACRGTLPDPGAVPGGAWGKAIVYAPRRVTVGDTLAWIERGIRDVPPPGAVIPEGHPICTVLARGPSRAACRARLEAGVAGVLAECDGTPRDDGASPP